MCSWSVRTWRLIITEVEWTYCLASLSIIDATMLGLDCALA